MDKAIPVYKTPIEEYTVVSNQSKTRYYKVCFGEVDWGRNGETEYAVYVRVVLLKYGQMQYQNYAAHILVAPGEDGRSDLDNVMEKIELLRKKHLR
ncbi:hypothetical protein [Oceanobacillus sp. FSL W7-1309]|uniref:hypothetical protein n=1 Tax=Oceanobacillus sp. FSL W7-1309 TaxID=2954539 RepID=UPI0030F86C73